MTDWIEWNGGECPIKSENTRVEVMFRGGLKTEKQYGVKWIWKHHNDNGDIISYRIIEDREPKEPKMTREQLTAQIAELQKQLDAMPVVRLYWDGHSAYRDEDCPDDPMGANYFDIETINGVPHIHGVAMKEVGK